MTIIVAVRYYIITIKLEKGSQGCNILNTYILIPKRPRANGNNRCKTCHMDSIDVRNGANIKRKVPSTTTPSWNKLRKNRAQLLCSCLVFYANR